jgi:hypothetical protein
MRYHVLKNVPGKLPFFLTCFFRAKGAVLVLLGLGYVNGGTRLAIPPAKDKNKQYS